MSATNAPARGRLVSHESYLLVFGTVYAAMATNIMLVVAGAPLVLLLVTTDPTRSWPLLAVAAVFATPGLIAAFGVFREVSDETGAPVVRTFWRTWRRAFRRSLAVGAMTVGAVVVLGVDVRAVWSLRVGAVAIPVFVVLAVLAVSTAVYAAALIPDRPGGRLRDLLRISLYASLRRWYLTAVSFLVLGLGFGLLAAKPAIALGLAAAPLLYVVWTNTRYAARSVLGDEDDGPNQPPVPAHRHTGSHP